MESKPANLKVFWDYCADRPDAPAIIEHGLKTWTRRETGESACRVRNMLEAQGVAAGNAVAIFAPNGAEFLIAYLGVTMLGARAVPMNHHLTHDEIAHVLHSSAARAVLAHQHLGEKLEHALTSLGEQCPAVVLMGRSADGAFDCPAAAPFAPTAPLPRHLGRTMLFTSATTGKPKAINYQPGHGDEWLARLVKFRELNGTRPDSHAVHLCASTLYHAGPLEGAVVTLHMGNVVALMRNWDARAALSMIAELRVTEAFLVPIMLVQLTRIPRAERSRHDLSSLRLLVHAGAPCPVDVKRDIIEWLGPVVAEGYGASEGGGTFVNSADWLRFPGTVGRPIPGASIRILSPQGDELPAGKEGLVYLRAYTGDRFEYAGNPAATASCYVGDHFTVGDVGYVNDQGFLFILDRQVNMIISGGTNIYPAEVEGVLAAHPYVADCAVVGLADEMFGEVVHAIVQAADDCPLAETQLKAELVRFAYRRLAPVKLPKTMEFTNCLPRDPNGKLLKRRLQGAGSLQH